MATLSDPSFGGTLLANMLSADEGKEMHGWASISRDSMPTDSTNGQWRILKASTQMYFFCHSSPKEGLQQFPVFGIHKESSSD